jgi:hypothetical protein
LVAYSLLLQYGTENTASFSSSPLIELELEELELELELELEELELLVLNT